MKQIIRVVFFVVCLITYEVANANTYYCSPSGSSSGSGTQYNPLDLRSALDILVAGDVLNLMDGQYDFDSRVLVNRSGTSDNLITIQAVNPRQAILDFRYEPYTPDGYNYVGLCINADYVHIKGLVVRYAGKNGILLTGGGCTLENIESYGNCNSGIQLKNCTVTNLVLNCDSHDNFDYEDSDGGNADGFADKQYTGPGNIYRGCRAWNNSDDGWDSFQRVTSENTPTIYENCVCYNNCPDTYDMSTHPRYTCGIDADWFNYCGKDISAYTHTGNGNGFKVGGAGTLHNIIMRRCLAAANKVKGFDQNNNSGVMEIYNCTSYYNGYNYGFSVGGSYDKSQSLTIKNCISYDGRTGNDYFTGTTSLTSNHNSWNTSGVSVSSTDFLSLDYQTYILASRDEEGNLQYTPLLRLHYTSEMKDAGTVVDGINYNGIAPDLGCFETDGAIYYNVSASASTGGTASVNPSGSVEEGTEVTFTATPNSGYIFSKWSDNSTENPRTVTVTGNLSLTATFVDNSTIYREITETTIFTDFTQSALTSTDWITPYNLDYTKCSTANITNYINPETDETVSKSSNSKYAQIKNNRYITFRVTNAIKATVYAYHSNSTANRNLTISDGTTTNSVTVAPGAAYSVSIDLDGTDKAIRIATDESSGVNAYAVKFEPMPTSLTLHDGTDYTETEDNTYPDGVTYIKNFTTANQWNPLYVPFAINIADYTSDLDIAEIFAVCPVEDTNGDGEITADDDIFLIVYKKTSGNTMPNKPYLIRAKTSGDKEIAAVDGKIYAAAAGTVICATTSKFYTFTGTYSKVYANAENDYWYMGSSGLSHKTGTGNVTIKSNRWYMSAAGNDSYDSTSNSQNSIGIKVIGEDIDNATAINVVKLGVESQNDAIYNLAGQKMNAADKPGLYIIKGMKVIK